MCTVPVARAFCRESYAEPLEVYERLKELGMDLVTVTDHDSVAAAADLARFPDFFCSEEVTCRLPSGTEAHVAVYDVSPEQHVELQRRRDDFPALLNYLHEQRLLFGINHVFSGLTGRRHATDYEVFEQVFPCLETLNGAMVARANELASQFARLHRKAATAGSDAHTVAAAGSAWTVVPEARSKREFLDGVRSGRGIAAGSSGGVWKLTRDVIAICSAMFRERPATVLLAPLLGGVPLYLLLNYWLEVDFAQRWFGRAVERSVLTGGVPFHAGEASL